MFRSPNFYRGLILGAGLMYLLDPNKGPARRAMLRDKITGTFHDGRDFVGAGVRDLRNRAEGAVHRTTSHIRPDSADDDTLAERVRAKLGRYVSHPRALSVEARDGLVTLHGPILRDEAETLIGAVSSVRGVREVLNRLEPHDLDDEAPGLKGRGRRRAKGSRVSGTVTPGLQLVAGVLGATAVAYGAGRIAARVRHARREELEREMPEYAMLR
jgi:hypothetical protein